MVKKILWITLFGAVLYGVYWTWNANEYDHSKKMDSHQFEKPVIIKKSVVYGFNKSHRNIRLVSDRAEIYQKQNITRLFTIHGEIYSKSKNSRMTRFKADFGRMDHAGKRLTLKENVRIELADGRLILTEKLLYYDTTGVISTDKPVTITSPDQSRITGSAMVYQSREDHLKITSPKMILKIN